MLKLVYLRYFRQFSRVVHLGLDAVVDVDCRRLIILVTQAKPAADHVDTALPRSS